MMQIIGAIGALITWFAAAKVDAILGKWVAYATAAWKNFASKRALESFRETMQAIQNDTEVNAASWEEWRKKHGIGEGR